MRFIPFLLLFVSLNSFGQKVYMSDRKFSNDLIWEREQQTIYRNSPTGRVDVLFIKNDVVYLKERMFYSDVKYTVSGNKIYRGNSTSVFDLLFTLTDGKLYIGDGSSSMDCLYTFKNGIIYRGDSTSTFDKFMAYDADESMLIWVALMILPY
jgi:hypothetical protein